MGELLLFWHRTSHYFGLYFVDTFIFWTNKGHRVSG